MHCLNVMEPVELIAILDLSLPRGEGGGANAWMRMRLLKHIPWDFFFWHREGGWTEGEGGKREGK
jgi:hypothetical protein